MTRIAGATEAIITPNRPPGRTALAMARTESKPAPGQGRERAAGDAPERDVHVTGFTEAALSGSSDAHTGVLGAAVQLDRYDARSVDGFDYAFAMPGHFVQDEYDATEWLTLSASGRLDSHSEYGIFLSPRSSALLRPADGWTVRASVVPLTPRHSARQTRHSPLVLPPPRRRDAGRRTSGRRWRDDHSTSGCAGSSEDQAG